MPLLTSDTPDGEPDTEKPAFGIEEFIGVYRASLGDHTVVYTGNIQAVRVLGGSPDWKELSRAEVVKELSKSELVDLHTTAFAKTNRQTYAYRKFISHKFWTHAYLLGTTEMVIGQRTGEGILMKLEEVTTDDMINLGKEHWNYKKSITKCEKTLTKIKAAFLEKINNLDPSQDAPTVKMFFKNNRYGISEVTPLQAKNFPKIDLYRTE